MGVSSSMSGRDEANFVLIPERETSDERPKHIWEDNPKINLKRQSGECGVVLSRSGQGLVAGSFEYGDETSELLKCREFLANTLNLLVP